MNGSIENKLIRAVDCLRDGQLVVFPTDTVYGLGASLFSEKGISDIFRVKCRSREKPLALHFANIGQISEFLEDMPDYFHRLADIFLPGALTLVMKKSDKVPDIVTSDLKTVAVRVPDNPISIRLVELLGHPLVATSANLSGEMSPSNAQQVSSELVAEIAMLIDGGGCQVGVESTIVDISGDVPLVLREGAISKKTLTEKAGLVF